MFLITKFVTNPMSTAGPAGNFNQESPKKKKKEEAHVAAGGTVRSWCVEEVSHHRASSFDAEMMERFASFSPPCPM